ncbi:MAG: hypothetical protein BWY89_01427 [Bacteroidetes bacterium ADurb.BinA012]|nr:MAG: hypothetical protein BWY89_01427 [Bacteroidetes bacterium ADurb.BinA012]
MGLPPPSWLFCTKTSPMEIRSAAVCGFMIFTAESATTLILLGTSSDFCSHRFAEMMNSSTSKVFVSSFTTHCAASSSSMVNETLSYEKCWKKTGSPPVNSERLTFPE